jgi:hypothetical protein
MMLQSKIVQILASSKAHWESTIDQYEKIKGFTTKLVTKF